MKICLPWNNLNELGFRLTSQHYVGIFRSPYWGMFISWGGRYYYVNFKERRVSKPR